MKKQTNLPTGGRKLRLNKKTISNLNATEMKNFIGGNGTNGAKCDTKHCNPSVDWCPGTGHHTCGCKF